eukprot:2580923-Pleurochrysis_carterae.AAC.6
MTPGPGWLLANEGTEATYKAQTFVHYYIFYSDMRTGYCSARRYIGPASAVSTFPSLFHSEHELQMVPEKAP